MKRAGIIFIFLILVISVIGCSKDITSDVIVDLGSSEVCNSRNSAVRLL